MNIKEFDCSSHGDSKIVIYGTTVGGKVIYQCLHTMGVSVAFFVDRSKKYLEFCDIPVMEPSVLYGGNNYIILIALTRSFGSTCQYLEQIGIQTAYSCKNLIKNRKSEDFLCMDNERELVEDFLKKYPIYAEGYTSKNIILPALEVFITERCTLRCRDCSHLIPRYQHPVDYDIEEIISYLKNVLKIVNGILDLIILGGEPFLHKKLYQLIDWGYTQQKIGTMTIISNGSVMPDERTWYSLAQDRCRIRISNYGQYSIKLNEIKEMCEKKNITCYINDELWTDMGAIYEHNYTENELKEIFTDCPFAYDLLLLKGKFFRCAHVAHLNNLQVIDSANHDCLDVNTITEEDISSKRNQLLQYMELDYLEGCQYCNGVKNSIQGITPAIQGER